VRNEQRNECLWEELRESSKSRETSGGARQLAAKIFARLDLPLLVCQTGVDNKHTRLKRMMRP
jgi:hypothetical protein